jgi:short-subunit dehydrogenase
VSRILIAGSTGFVGRSLVNYFNQRDYVIYTISRRKDPGKPSYSLNTQDLLSMEGTTFANMGLDAFVYAIGDPQMQGKSDGEIELLQGIISKLESFSFTGKFILISSNAANPSSGLASDNYSRGLTNEYISRKQMLENALIESSLKFTILRAPAVIGPGMNDHSHLMRLIKKSTLRRVFQLPIFSGTVEVITADELAHEIENLMTLSKNVKIIEPVVPCYTWSNLARHINKGEELSFYKGNGIKLNQEKISRFLPVSIRFLLFPHWVTKNLGLSTQVSNRHQMNIETISHLKSTKKSVHDWHIVTGSSSGLGAETVRLLIMRGYKVIGVDIIPPAHQSDYLNPSQDCFRFIQTDLSSDKSVEQLLGLLKPLNIAGIYSIAGVGPRADATNTTKEILKKTFEVNFFLPVALYHFLGSTSQQKSYFVFVGSSSGILGLPKFSAYSSTKSALSTYFFSVICEDTSRIVDILGIIPSGMKTNFQKNNGVPTSPLDKFLLTAPSKVATQMVDWMENERKKSVIRHVGISGIIFMAIRNLPFNLKKLIVAKLSEGSR